MHRRIRILVAVAKRVVIAAFGLLALAIVLSVAGVRSPFPPTEITHQEPYSHFIGREYRVTSDVSAYAWNDFPDKAKILSISLVPPPGIRNRFVSYVIPLQHGQSIRLVGAWRSSHHSPGSTLSRFRARDCPTASQLRWQ